MPTFTKKNNITIGAILAVVLIGFGFANFFFKVLSTPEFLMVFANYAATGLGAFLGIYASLKIGLRNFVGKGLFFLGLTSLFSFIGYVLWDYYSVVMGIELPYPSLADVSWALGVPAAILGVAFILRIYQPQLKSRFILEALGIFIVATLVVVYFIGVPDLTDATWSSGFFDVFYTITDVIWLALAFITLRIAGGKIFNGLLVYTIAILILAIGDILFAIRSSNETYFYGDISDLTLLTGWILATAGIYLTAQTFTSTETHA